MIKHLKEYTNCEECGIRIATRWYFQEPGERHLCDNCTADLLHDPEYWD